MPDRHKDRGESVRKAPVNSMIPNVLAALAGRALSRIRVALGNRSATCIAG